MGFAKEWKLGPVGKFSGKALIKFSENTLRFIGIVWLITCLLLLASTGAYYFQQDWFWLIGIVAIIFSQTLVIIYWPDAKWATIMNVIISIIIICGWSGCL
jgi:hypothetical protein